MIREITVAAVPAVIFLLFTACGVKPEGRANLALKRPVFCSSFEKANRYNGNVDLKPEFAVDGSMETHWSSDYFNDEDPDAAWLYVDLGSSTNFQEVKIYWNEDMAKSFTLETSDDARSWAVIKDIATNTVAGDDIKLDKPVKSRYLKVNCRRRATKFGYSILELEVY